MKKINLSYVISTFNKLPYLKEAMVRLINNLKEDEEIVVVDGGSSDGSAEYLKGLFDQGKIQQYVSELDYGEAHGYNKGLLLAKGVLVKGISDDDVYFFPAIEKSKDFMLQHPAIDIIYSNVATISLENLSEVKFDNAQELYLNWMRNRSPFIANGLSIMMRRDALALTGLLFSAMKWPDAEFGLRVTSSKITIAWNTALMVIRIDNPQSNWRNFGEHGRNVQWLADHERMQFFYNNAFREKYKKEYLRIIDFSTSDLLKEIRKRIYLFISFSFVKFQRFIGIVSISKDDKVKEADVKVNYCENNTPIKAFNYAEDFLVKFNSSQAGNILIDES